jgi:hypothetical protein
VEQFLQLQHLLWIAASGAEALVLVRLFREGLLSRYPFFASFLAAEAICSVILIQIGVGASGYALAYRTCTLIMTLFRLGVAAELYEFICDHFPGMGVFRALMAVALVLLGGTAAVLTIQPNIIKRTAHLTLLIGAVRYQNEIFAVAFISTWIFLRFGLSIRQPFRPNVLTHWTIATVYFGAAGTAYFAILLAGGKAAVYPINSAMLAIQLGCFIAWFLLLRRSGEELPDFAKLSPDQVDAVENYNRELLGTVRSLPNQIAVRQAENRDLPLHRAGRW